MPDERDKNRKKLQSLLRDLFQFDHADLNFGIYKIMNRKRGEVKRFIEHDLLDVVEEALARFREADREELETQLAEKRSQLGGEALDEDGAVREQFRGIPIAQEYMELHQQLQQIEVAEETEARVFNDLWRFFNRYYDQGDFLTERRYSSRGAKYCVPYNGEEVMLHWANRKQYYVKTTERFTDYRFKAGEYTVWFQLQQADVSQDNVKGNTRHFVLHDEEQLTYDEESGTLTIPFAYRPLTDDEEDQYVAVHNELTSDDKSRLKRGYICEALEHRILDDLEDTTLKASLSAAAPGKERSVLYDHLNRYTARHTMDYFVHKDLGGFLRRELDVFLKTEVMHLGDVIEDEAGEVTAHVLTRMRVVRQIARRIIDFLAQIEDFQKRLFEKRKFVVQTDYCVTLDRVPEALYPAILENEAQLNEWRSLYQMDKWRNDLFWQGTFDEAFLRNHPYLMIDTAFFDEDVKARLLASFDDLDGATDGVLIHGENFQALNLLREKYRERVKCIYIDPPYNTGNDGFVYKDNYQHSSWLTMMRDRMQSCRPILTQNGAIFISIDDNEVHRLNNLLRGLYGEDNSAALLIARTNPRGRTLDRYIAKTHEYITAFVKEPVESAISEVPKPERMIAEYDKEDEQGRYRELGLRNRNPVFTRENRPNLFFPLYVNPDTGAVSVQEREGYDIEVYPRNSQGEDDCWTWSQERVSENADVLVGRQVSTGAWRVYRKDYLRDESGSVATTMVKSVWLDKSINNEWGKEALRDLIGYHTVDFPKAVELIRKCIEIGATEDGWVMDFFAGSGTTAHAVMDLNREVASTGSAQGGGRRKYILVEMGDYFDTVLKPRILKVAFSANWKDGVPQDREGMSQVVKYHRIESYEDALNNIRVQEPGEKQLKLLREFDDYMLHYMLDFETRGSPTLLALESFEKPFDYTLKIQRGHESPEDTPVDLVETFHYLIGMHVRRLERHEHQGRTYVVSRGEVRTERGIERVVTIWRDTEGLDIEQEADWADAELLTDLVDRVYVNGYEHCISQGEPTEIAFRKRMEADNH